MDQCSHHQPAVLGTTPHQPFMPPDHQQEHALSTGLKTQEVRVLTHQQLPTPSLSPTDPITPIRRYQAIAGAITPYAPAPAAAVDIYVLSTCTSTHAQGLVATPADVGPAHPQRAASERSARDRTADVRGDIRRL